MQNPRQNSYAGTGCRHYTMYCFTFEQQVPRTYARTCGIYTIHALYMLRMRVRVPSSRVGPRLYIACFTPVAPVASLLGNIRPTSCPSRSYCVSLIPKLREKRLAVSSNSFAFLFYLSQVSLRRGTIISAHII